MKKSFAARRVPRKIGQDDDEEMSNDSAPATDVEPSFKKSTSKAKKSSLRTSFGPSVVEDDNDTSDASGVVTPKKTLSRVAVQRNAAKRSSNLSSNLPTRDLDNGDTRPMYSASSLQQLKESTPSTPRDLASDVDDVSSGTQALDLCSKFGSSLARYQQSAIPSATEIAEKKARRARLAKEQQAEEYISLDPDDPDLDGEESDENVMRDDSGRLVLKPKDKYQKAESRLVRDDEDIMEDFDDFTEDGKISLGRRAEAEAARKRKQDMAARIAEAEGAASDDSDASDSSEKMRNEAFEEAQTRHGTYAANATADPYKDQRPKTPPKIAPLPTLDGAVERLRLRLGEMQTSRAEKLKIVKELQQDKVKLAEDEIRIQEALKETAEKFRNLREEKGISGAVKEGTPVAIDAPTSMPMLGDGSATPAADTKEKSESEEPEETNGLGSGGAGVGLGFGARGFSGTGGLGMPQGESDEDDY